LLETASRRDRKNACSQHRKRPLRSVCYHWLHTVPSPHPVTQRSLKPDCTLHAAHGSERSGCSVTTLDVTGAGVQRWEAKCVAFGVALADLLGIGAP